MDKSATSVLPPPPPAEISAETLLLLQVEEVDVELSSIVATAELTRLDFCIVPSVWSDSRASCVPLYVSLVNWTTPLAPGVRKNPDGTIQKSNIVSSAVATIDDSSTSTSSTWSSSKVSAEISAGGGGADTSFYSFTKSTNNSSAGFFSDGYVVIGWDGYDEIMIRQPTARSGVYATGLFTYSGSYPSGQHMLLSTVNNDFYQNANTGQIEFTISADSDNTHPFYRVRFHISSSTGTDYCYAIVEKFT